MIKYLFSAAFVSSFFCVFLIIHGAELLEGNAAAETGTSFTFAIGKTRSVYQNGEVAWYFSADSAVMSSDGVNDFAVSAVRANAIDKIIYPLAPEKVILNGVADSLNPFFNQGISLFNVMTANLGNNQKQQPIAVINSDLQRLYAIIDVRPNSAGELSGSVISSSALPDVTGAPTTRITSLGVAEGASSWSPYLIATVAPANGGNFGDPGSGIALATMRQKNDQAVIDVLDAPTGSAIFPTGPRALPFDVDSSVVALGSSLSSLSARAIIWDSKTVRFFISLDVQGGAGVTDGARALAVVSLNITSDNSPSQGLSITPIAPATAFAASGNFIVGQIGPHAQLSLPQIAVMHTSTGLTYLIVQGGLGASGTNDANIFALPLIAAVEKNISDDLVGTIAAKNSEPIASFGSSKGNTECFFFQRTFVEPAITPDQMPMAGEAPVDIGGGPLPYGSITDIVTKTDAVIVTVANAVDGNKPGVFSSQAIFSSTGKIIGWTSWQRAASTTDSIKNVVLDPQTGSLLWLAYDQLQKPTIVKRSLWGLGDPNGFFPAQTNIVKNFDLEQTLLSPTGGVYSATNFSLGSPGISGGSFLGLGGQQGFMMMQTGVMIGTAAIPVQGPDLAAQIICEQSTIPQNFPVDDVHTIFFTGGVLTDLGPVLTATTGAALNNNGWLFVGGTGGVAVLSQDDGSGWDTTIGLGDRFVGLTAGMSFKKLGNYCNVRRLIVDGEFLYILSYTGLDRINLNDPSIGQGTPAVTTIATPSMIIQGASCRLVPIFLDFIPSNPVGLLGTSEGLLRNGDNTTITTIDSPDTGLWTLISLPENVGPVYRFYPITVTGNAYDYAQGIGGNVYLLNSARSQDRGRLYRLAVTPSGAFVTPGTITLFDDYFRQGFRSYFANLGQFKSCFYTDGALFFNSHDFDFIFPRANPPAAFSLRLLGNLGPGVPFPVVGQRFMNYPPPNTIALFTGADAVLNQHAVRLTGVLKPCTTGSYFTCGNYGVRLNE